MGLATAVVAVLSGQAAARSAVDARTVAAERCEKAVAAAVDRYAAAHDRDAAKCVASLVRCLVGRPGDDACPLRASATCAATYEKQPTLLATLRAAIVKRCDDTTLFAADSVGFGGVSNQCAEKAATTSVDQAVTCVADATTCSGSRALSIAAPRTAALLRANGIQSSLPLGTSCLPEYVSVRGVGDATDAGPLTAPCTTAMVRDGARDADAWRGAFGKCLGALFGCGDPAGGVDACWARAGATCDAAFRKVPSVDPSAGDVDGACAEAKVPFAALASAAGGDVSALGPTCAAVGIAALGDAADWRACVTRSAACEVADAMDLVYPRADALLARVGRSRLPAFCPGYVPVPTRTATPRPTATATPGSATSTAEGPTPVSTAIATATVTPIRTLTPTRTATPTPTGTAPTTTPSPIPTSDGLCDADPSPYGIPARPTNTTCRLDGSPDQFPTLQVVRAFPGLTFSAPVQITHPPDGTDRLFVVEQTGNIKVFPNVDATTQVTTFLDVSALSNYSGEEGLLSIAFHPDYANNGFFYIFYSAANPRRSVIARYHVSNDPNVADPASATIILQYEKPYENHNGGQLAFGPDGMLYVSVGDGGSAGNPGNEAQDKSQLLGKVLRLDVDHADPGLAYGVPPDNPFVGDATARGEIWALGLRNPWRMSFDRLTHALWLGDVGQGNWEEVDLVERGNNYGWRRMEGNACYNPDTNCDDGTLTPPLAVYSHANAACAVIGGVVYRGTQLPELYGAYLYGDYCNGSYSALRYDGADTTVQPLASSFVATSSIGEDRDGEVLITNVIGGTLHRFSRPSGAASPGAFPLTLSATGCFDDLATRHPAPGLVPYDVISPLWSDGAQKRRFMMVPYGTTIGYTASGTWNFPVGTILVKEFSFDLEAGNPASNRALETRFLVRQGDGWHGYSYQWNDAQTEAYLLDTATTATFDVTNPAAPGVTTTHTHYFPSRGDCVRCHAFAAGGALGLQTAELNRVHDYGGVSDNQLRALEHAGFFGACLPARPASLPRLTDPSDVTAPLDARARSYLQANCAQCHRPGGTAPTAFDLRADTPFAATGLCDALAQAGDLGVADARIVHPGHPEQSVLWLRAAMRGDAQMPPIATLIPDPTGTTVLADWISGLGPCP